MSFQRIKSFSLFSILLLVSCNQFASINSSSGGNNISIPSPSEYVHPENQIIINRDSWPLLSHAPYVPTDIYFRNVSFQYFGATDESSGSITGLGNTFFLFNKAPIDQISKIELHLVRAKIGSNPETFSLHVSSSNQNPRSSSEIIQPEKISPILYEWDLLGFNVNYFTLINGIYKIEIKQIIIHLSDNYSEASPREIPSFENDESSPGYYLLETPTISRNDFKNVTGSPLDGAAFPHIGSPKTLIVPINFNDIGCVGAVACQTREKEIYDAFLGEAEDTGYESVKSYYYKSSYGKLIIDGVVTPTYEVGMTADAWARQSDTQPTWSLGNDIVDWYKQLTRSNLSDFDSNEDGWIDTLIMIYNAPSYPNGNYRSDVQNTFWAYAWWNFDNLRKGTPSNPVPFTFFFASFDFMYEGIYLNAEGTKRLVDPHTFIHEVGHILGLQDYYSYDDLDGDWGAAGKIDMMDNNILDHNAYSKFLLEWTNPFVIDNKQEEFVVELKPFESSGETILINNNFNGSPYDEYLLIEYYTPTGLNEQHAKTPYPGNNLQGFTESGLKIYHIDSRIGEFNASNGAFIRYLDEINSLSESQSSYALIVNANSPSRHNGTQTHQRLVHLLEANGQNTFRQGFGATNNTLFQEGDWFDSYKHYSNLTTFGTFNDGSDIGYRIIVENLEEEKATLRIQRFYM